MNFALSKLLPLFVYPLGMVSCLLLIAVILLSAGRKRSAGVLLVFSLVLLWCSSTLLVAEKVLFSLERLYPPIALEKISTADAIVVLGGVTRGRVAGSSVTDLGSGADRLVHAARLFKADKAPLLVLSGGNAPGYRSEAEDMADILQLMGIPAESMLLERRSRNTRQNASYCYKIFRKKGIKKILLVTSASHMRRAEAVFTGLGMTVIPAATDYQVVEHAPSFLDWLPQADSLEMTTTGIKEYIGYWVYLCVQALGRSL